MLWRITDQVPSYPPGDGSISDYDDGRWTGNSANGQSLALPQLVGILLRRTRMILAIAGIGTIVSVTIALMVSPKYAATVQLVVESQPVTPVGGRAASPIDEAVDTHVALIGSRGHLRRVAESLAQDSMLREPTPEAGRPDATATEAGRRSHKELKRNLNVGIETSGRGGGGTWLGVWIEALGRRGDTLSRDLEELERSVKVFQERRSRVISVIFTSENREKAAAWANRVAQLYIDGQPEQQQRYSISELTRINARMAALRNEMDGARLSAQKALQQASSVPNASSEGRKADEHVQELDRSAAAASQQYYGLLRRQKELRDQLDMVAPGIWIRSLAAVPERPSSHSPILFVLPALIVFMIAGSLLAVALDRLDRGMRSERDVSDALGIPCIGLVPRMPSWCRAEPHHYLVGEPFSAYAEAIRSVFSALCLEPVPRTCQVALVSSSLPSEGKTTLTVSLATYAALIGRRVLLIDLDIRHPSIRPMLGGEGEKDVAELFLSNSAHGEAIQHIPDPGLDYLSITQCPIDPVELLVGDQMSKLIGRLRKSYDWILIDGPPALGATEARLLARLADKVILVVKWASTRPEIAQNAVNQLSVRNRLGKKNSSRLLSIVTQVDLKKHARYRYGDIGEMRAGVRSTPVLSRREDQMHLPTTPQQQAAEAEGIER